MEKEVLRFRVEVFMDHPFKHRKGNGTQMILTLRQSLRVLGRDALHSIVDAICPNFAKYPPK